MFLFSGLNTLKVNNVFRSRDFSPFFLPVFIRQLKVATEFNVCVGKENPLLTRQLELISQRCYFWTRHLQVVEGVLFFLTRLLFSSCCSESQADCRIDLFVLRRTKTTLYSASVQQEQWTSSVLRPELHYLIHSTDSLNWFTDSGRFFSLAFNSAYLYVYYSSITTLLWGCDVSGFRPSRCLFMQRKMLHWRCLDTL